MTPEELILQIVDFYKETLSSQKTIDKFKDTLIVKVKVTYETKTIDPNDILATVSEATKMPIEKIKSNGRKPNTVTARQIYCALAKEYTKLIQSDISDLICRDRTTFIHCIENHEKALFRKNKSCMDKRDIAYFNLYDSIEQKLIQNF
jgi:chromosomal replication initiation ATPase DnaA